MAEFSLIDRYFTQIGNRHANTVLGSGDDAAISYLPVGCQLVSCTDTLVAGRHFLANANPHAIAYKAVAVNLSDLAAMAATPFAILLAISLPKSLAHADFLAPFRRGLTDICQEFGVELIGGDTTQSDILSVSITALGTVPNGQAIHRHTAQIGDVICVSGQIGSASYALTHLLNHPDTPTPLQHTLDYPQPQIALAHKLRGIAHSMIDISDGLAQDLGHILSRSGVGAKLFLHQIPCHTLLNELPKTQKWQHQLTGGDDYQLICTLSRDDFDKFKQQHPNELSCIGEITDSGCLQLFDHDEPVEFDTAGWQHF